MMTNVLVMLLLMILFGGAVVFYFLPGIIALRKGRKNAAAIMVLNILAGWTFIGWLVALIWAVTE